MVDYFWKYANFRGRHGRYRMVVGFTTTYAISVNSNPAHSEVYYVIKFVSDHDRALVFLDPQVSSTKS